MHLIKKTTVIATVALLAWGCEKSKSSSESKLNNDVTIEQIRADSASFEPPVTSIARMGLIDSVRKFVVSAELKFRAKDVVKTTYAIENLTINTGGFVTYTELHSAENYRNVVKISADSSLESIFYTVENYMTLRIPKANLDSFLRGVGNEVDYFDYRIVKANDVGLDLLANNLKQKRLATYEKSQQQNINKPTNKPEETYYAQENLLDKQMQADEAAIQKLKTEDEVKYSFVALTIYQREAVKRTMAANTENIHAYEPGFISRIGNGLAKGWQLFENLIVALANIWTLIMLAILVFIAYRRFWARLKNK
jgi:hypothetical protein